MAPTSSPLTQKNMNYYSAGLVLPGVYGWFVWPVSGLRNCPGHSQILGSVPTIAHIVSFSIHVPFLSVLEQDRAESSSSANSR